MQIYNSLDEVVEAGSIAPDSIINADCLEAMKFIPDKSIDCIICDLPYGVTACKWDIVIPFDLLWEQYKRIIKPNGAIVLFGSQPFTSALVMSNPKWFKYEWIWEKTCATGFLDANKKPLKNHENILIFYHKSPRYNPQKQKGEPYIKKRRTPDRAVIYNQVRGPLTINKGSRYPKTVLPMANGNYKSPHPTQKPVALIEYLLKTYTLENELILDNTAGSGTLAIAAINTNRRYICIEKDPGYFEVMRDRIESHDPNALAAPKKARKPKAIPEGQLRLFG
mgnify:CR=1 FL=1